MRKGKQIERNPLTVRRPPFTFVVKEVSWEYHTQCTVIKACLCRRQIFTLVRCVYYSSGCSSWSPYKRINPSKCQDLDILWLFVKST